MLQRGFARAAVPDDAAVHVSELVARLRRGVLRATRAPLAVTRGRPGSASALSSVSFVGDAESSLGDPRPPWLRLRSQLGELRG
jgi:hypothetical protein